MRSSESAENGNISDTFQDYNGSLRVSASSALNSTNSAAQHNHPLYSRGVCTWAGCDTNCDTFAAFAAHLNRDHVLDERSTAQTRVQVKTLGLLQ